MTRAFAEEEIFNRRMVRRTDSEPQFTSRKTLVLREADSNCSKTTVEHDENVYSSIKLIERAAGLFDDLQKKINEQDHEIRTREGEIAQLKRQEEAFRSELTRAEQIIRADNERASRAEARAVLAEVKARQLEAQVATINSQLERLMQAVTESFIRTHEAGGSSQLVSRSFVDAPPSSSVGMAAAA